METKIFNSSIESLIEASNILNNDGVVVFPTETVYGIGAIVSSKIAVEKIYKVKGRPSDNPLIIHINDKKDIYKYAFNISDKAKKIIEVFWPGPISIILKKKNIGDYITAGLDTVAIRNPKNKIARKLISLAGDAIAAPSANFSGRPSGTASSHVMNFDGKVDAIIIGENCEIGLESTVIDMSSKNITLLRPGAISREDIESVIGKINISYSSDMEYLSPGLRYKHYSPNSKVVILRGSDKNIKEFIVNNNENAIFILKDSQINDKIDKRQIRFMPNDDKKLAANRLFSLLIEYDNRYDTIYFSDISLDGIGTAVMDRLFRASNGNYMDL